MGFEALIEKVYSSYVSVAMSYICQYQYKKKPNKKSIFRNGQNWELSPLSQLFS